MIPCYIFSKNLSGEYFLGSLWLNFILKMLVYASNSKRSFLDLGTAINGYNYDHPALITVKSGPETTV